MILKTSIMTMTVSAITSMHSFDPSESLDTDGDGIGNNADADDDGDGIEDTADETPIGDEVFVRVKRSNAA